MNQTETFRSELFQFLSKHKVKFIGCDHIIMLFDGETGMEEIKLNTDGVFSQFTD